MRLKELKTYKESVIDLLLKSDNIVKAIVNPEENFLDIPINIKPTSLVYKNIFPYAKIPSIEDDPKTYITIKVGGFRLYNGTYKIGYIEFYVFTHYSLMKTDEGTRTDFIISEIDEIFNNKKNIFANSLAFAGMDEITISRDYYGSTIKYKGIDIN